MIVRLVVLFLLLLSVNSVYAADSMYNNNYANRNFYNSQNFNYMQFDSNQMNTNTILGTIITKRYSKYYYETSTPTNKYCIQVGNYNKIDTFGINTILWPEGFNDIGVKTDNPREMLYHIHMFVLFYYMNSIQQNLYQKPAESTTIIKTLPRKF